MGALGPLGIGLSVLFGIFLVVLAGEIYYMLCCRRRAWGAGSNSRRVSSVQVVEAQAAAAATDMGGFAREAALVGSFGGYPGAPFQSEFVSKFFPPPVDCSHISPLDGILFTIAEETKEEMELHSGTPFRRMERSGSPPLPKLSDSQSVVETLPPIACSSVTISLTEASVCTSSTSVSFSVTPDATPFATPPSSPSASDTSSDDSLSCPSASPATAVSRLSAQSWSPVSASSSPATAASRFSVYSPSLSSTTASPATANSRLSVNSPVSVAVSPAVTRLAAVSPASSSPASQRSSIDASYVCGDHGPLGALFRRQYNSPSRYSPLRPVVWSSQITDFRHALPFSPPNAQFFMNR